MTAEGRRKVPSCSGSAHSASEPATKQQLQLQRTSEILSRKRAAGGTPTANCRFTCKGIKTPSGKTEKKTFVCFYDGAKTAPCGEASPLARQLSN